MMTTLWRTIAVEVLIAPPAFGARAEPQRVDAGNFDRAETDMYFARTVKDAGLGQLKHSREPTSIDKQSVVRMNRDTLYSSGVFDLDAAPVTITLPDAGKRFLSLQVVSQDHYAIDVNRRRSSWVRPAIWHSRSDLG